MSKKNRPRLLAVLLVTAVSVSLLAFAGGESKLPIIRITPDEVKWVPSPELHGLETAVLAGDPTKPGLYTVRVKIPAGHKIKAHWHPEDRMVTIISGTFHFGYGDQFDATKLKEFPPSSFLTEPAKQTHFAWAKSGDVIVQATGIGPTGTTFVE